MTNLKKILDSEKVSGYAIAKHSKMNQQTVYRYINGENELKKCNAIKIVASLNIISKKNYLWHEVM